MEKKKKTVASDKHLVFFYIQTSIFGAYFYTCQSLTPLNSINPCCALNTKRTRTFFAVCEFNSSYSGQLKDLPQQLNFAFSYLGWVLPFTYSAVGAQRLCVFCLVMKMKMVLKIYKGGRFYAPTQVVLLFVKVALCLEC